MLRGRDWLKGQASITVVFILGGNEGRGRRVLDKGWHGGVTLVDAGDGHPIAVVLDGGKVLLALNESRG